MNFKIRFTNVSKYANEEGKIMEVPHPAIILEDKDSNYKILLTSTSDCNKSVPEARKNPNDPRFFITRDLWITSRIQNYESLQEAKRYYRDDEGRYMFSQKLTIGDVCYHKAINHRSYISENCAIINKNERIRYTNPKDEGTIYHDAELCEKFKDAILSNKINFYLSSNTPQEKNIDFLSLCIKNKIDICYKLEQYKRSVYNEKYISKSDFIKNEVEHIRIFKEESSSLILLYKEERLKTVNDKIEWLQNQNSENHSSTFSQQNIEKYRTEKNILESKIQELKKKAIEEKKNEFLEELIDLDIDTPSYNDEIEETDNLYDTKFRNDIDDDVE